MIIQLHKTDRELAQILGDLGYDTELIHINEVRSANHTRDEVVTVSRLHVIDRGEKKPAKEFFEHLLDKSLISLMIANK